MYIHALSWKCFCNQIEYSVYKDKNRKLRFEYGDRNIPFAQNDWVLIKQIDVTPEYHKKTFLPYQLKEHTQNECKPQPK